MYRPDFDTDALYEACCWGQPKLLTEHLSEITPAKIPQMIAFMEDKIRGIQMWSCEEDNQSRDRQTEFNVRSNGIDQCIAILYRFSSTVQT